MKTLKIFLLLTGLALLVLLFIFAARILPLIFHGTESLNFVCRNENCFKVEIAKTNEERAQGLMYRQKLGEKEGMLFVFEKEGLYSFWMKNTLIPLDIIWVDNNYMVVFIKQNAQPCANDGACDSIIAPVLAKYVLEVNSGVSEKIGLKIGEKLDFKIN